jgi:hypothetical protein
MDIMDNGILVRKPLYNLGKRKKWGKLLVYNANPNGHVNLSNGNSFRG